ncbi:MAG: hypothetical protein IKT30_08685, partial [Bacteroidaceae bacterium]|nr:hypothetical protein [Bacteroidaceae bacterium]
RLGSVFDSMFATMQEREEDGNVVLFRMAGEQAEQARLDKEYVEAVKSGDIDKALDMLREKALTTEGITGYVAPNAYSGSHRDVAKLIKTGKSDAVQKAAADMARFVPNNAVLVPIPSHEGKVTDETDTKILADAVAEITGSPVVVALEGNPRESRYQAKQQGKEGLKADELGFRQIAEIPEGKIPVFIDNVVDSGETAKAASEAIKGGFTMAYAKGVRSNPTSDLKNMTVTYDDNGNLIPLSQRFDADNTDVRFREANANQAIFVSNAQKAVENIKQEKATPEQWLAMIRSKGGLKAGEDKWMGLSQWLNDKKAEGVKTLTKPEVLDFIDSNKIEIEEERYAEEGAFRNTARFKEFNDEYRNLVADSEEKWEEADRDYAEFMDDMRGKYGEDWDSAMTDSESHVEEQLLEAREMWQENPAEAAFNYMVEEYGDDFGTAFMYDEDGLDIADPDAAAYYLEGDGIINDVRLGYTTEGLENKREIALTVPTIEPWDESDKTHFGDAGGGTAIGWIRFGETWTREDAGITHPVTGKEVSAKRDAKTLVIDEIQSKRHQEGREKGYRNPISAEQKDLYNELKSNHYEAINRLSAFVALLNSKYGSEAKFVKPEDLFEPGNKGHERWLASFSKEDRSRYNTLDEEVRKASVAVNNMEEELGGGDFDTRVPDAPFDKNWPELCMKRMLRLAAEEGYGKMAWTSGEIQADRYDLGRQVRSIFAGFDQDGNRGLLIHLLDGPTIDIIHDDKGNIIKHNSVIDGLDAAKNISDLVGKEIAADALTITGKGTANGREYKDDALRVGISGMQGFYDKMLPAFMTKYGKQWGVKPELQEFPDIHGKWWTIDITPEMKADVMEGQVMFRIGNNERTHELNDKQKNPGEDHIIAEPDVFERKTLDEAYQDAYMRGDTELAESMVRDAFKAAYPNTKVVDKKGEPLVVEHATNDDFTEFDIDYLGKSSKDKGLFGAGFYFGTHAPRWLGETKNIMKVFLGMNKPFEIDDSVKEENKTIYHYLVDKFDIPALRALVLTQYKKSINLGEYIDIIKAVDAEIERGEHDEKLAADEEIQNSYRPQDKMPVYRYQLISKRAGDFGSLPNSIQYIIAEAIGSEEFSAALKEGGYDGVIADRSENYKEYVAFYPSQIKSAETFTFDDQGNLIPLSQRFNEQDDDIRFRLSKNNRKTVESWLNKRTDIDAAERESTLAYIDNLADAKTQLATGWWFAKGTIRLPEDMPKVEQAVAVSTIAKVDPLKYSSPMELINAHADIQVKEKPINPDEVSTLHKHRELPDGIVIYDVDDSEESRKNMRAIIDTHFGKESSPWCLLQGDGEGNLTSQSREYWDYYNSYPKQVAFKDGKLLAFSANRGDRLWWDKQDRSYYGIPVTGKIPGDEQGRMADMEYNSETGKLMSVGRPYIGNRNNGEFMEWFDVEGPLIERSHFKDGRRVGKFETWYPDGTRKEFFQYDEDGRLHGPMERWYENGQQQTKGQFYHSMITGEYKEWYPNGQLAHKSIHGEPDEYNFIHRIAPEEEWHPNGTKKKYMPFDKDGKINGRVEFWNASGDLIDSVEYKDGRKDGEEIFYQHGQPVKLTYWRNGSWVGEKYLALTKEEDGIRFRETPSLFSPEEMVGNVAGSQRSINFAGKNRSNAGAATDIQRQGDTGRTQNDRSGTSDIQRQGDTPGAAYPRVNNPKGVKDIIPPLRGLEEGETCLVERKMSEDKNFSFIAGNKIESLDDIAYIFKQLENKAIENAFVVFHGGPGTKVQDAYVLHIGMGGIANSSVDLSPIIPMLNAVHPKQVTLVHNHPSGNIVSSRQDRALLQSVTDLVKTYARYADVTPGIIIDTTRGVYGTFDVNSQDAVGNMPDKAKDEVKVPVYKFDEAAFSPEYKPQHMKSIRTSLDVARFVASHRLGERRKVNVLCLDNAAHVIGNFFSDLTDVSTEDEARRLARECAHYAGACGARLVCVFGTGIPMNSASVAATKRLLKTADIEMVDALSIIDENYSYFSYADRGLLNEPENGYAAKAEGTAEKQTRYDMPESSGDEEVRFRRVTDPLTIARLETGKKARGYRTVKVNEDGSFGSPMAGKLGKAGEQSKATSSFYLGQWEEAEENPGLANKNGKINLIKPQGRGSVNGVDYNPYIHIRPTTLNKQFTQAWNRPELAYIETEYPESELTSGYKAEKAAKSVGRHRWNGGELILSRWDKPLRIVPWEEVADGWEDEFGETGVTFDIVPPALLQILDERGVEILAPKKSAGQAAMDAYNNWRNGVESETTMFRMSDTSDRREDESPMQFTWRIKDAYEDDFNTIDDTHILSGQEMLSKEGFRRMMNILLNVDIDALYEDYKEDFADKDKDGGRYEYEGIEPKIIIFARDETTSGEQVMTEMLHENVHGTIGEVPANAVPSMIRFFAGRYGEDARRWAEDLYQLLKKIDAEEADNEFITYNLSHDLFHRREYERVKGYAGGDEQLESFFNGIVNRIKKTENADERRKGDDGQAGRDGESLAGRTQAEAAGTGVGYTNSIQGKRDAVTDSAAKPGMEYGGSEVGDNGNLGGPDDEVRWRTVEPTDYEDSAADMTERCKAVGANLGVAVEVINEPKNSFKSSYQDGKLTINIGALNGDSPLEAALMAMCREMPLSDILGADAVREFAQELYRELPEFRQKVVEIAQQSYGWDTARAMMEYLGSMAESTTDDAESQDTWDIIETAFNKMIDKVLNRAPMGWRWVEGNTLRYILFQNAHQGDKSIATIARGAALAHNLGLSAADDEN